ncbi:SGNH/GDSL hydrolase family protein [Altererythrobacter soli]|uniref:SGNH/GDSL hydrolase family protein n=1 Tax=Croceibacterium soli TaxID=1739690 RepID=A0A6I4USX9_9SPHN|nr:SGNH/GDSL hydrolase family protein [Croceibacterium soli]MXP41861.1 SGNH/GDSL hydrolase family protein [Croceibacterium soli]
MVAFAVAALSACTTLSDSLHPVIPIGGSYVAMGSSFAAGPGLGSPKAGTPARCARDERSYPTLLAQSLGLRLFDVTCSGATTDHILGPWDELPSQLDALTSDTRLVTLTIGGNDVNYVGNLFAASCDPAATAQPCAPVRMPDEADWSKLEVNLREIVAQVRSRAPLARLVFVDYVTLVPERETCAALRLSSEISAGMRQLGERLARITARVARENGAELLPAGELSRGRTPCHEQSWSVGAPGTGSGAPWHPNAAGMSGIAEALARRLS